MARFKDRSGRSWEIEFNGAVAIRLKNAGYDLMQVLEKEGEMLAKLQHDTCYLVGLLYEACAKQCDERGVSPDDFGSMLYAEVLEEAAHAVADELVVFLRSRGPLVRKALEKMTALEERARAMGMAELEAVDVEALLQSRLGHSGGGAAASSASPATT